MKKYKSKREKGWECESVERWKRSVVKVLERWREGFAGKFAEWFKIVQFDPLLSKQKSNPYFTSNLCSPEPALVRFSHNLLNPASRGFAVEKNMQLVEMPLGIYISYISWELKFRTSAISFDLLLDSPLKGRLWVRHVWTRSLSTTPDWTSQYILIDFYSEWSWCLTIKIMMSIIWG